MRNLLGRLRRSGSRSLVEQLATLTSVGDGSTLTLDFTTGVLDPRLTFTRSSTATYIGADGLVKTMAAAPTNDPTKARFDYDPTTLSPRGLLIEGAATNLCEQGQYCWGAGTTHSWGRSAQVHINSVNQTSGANAVPRIDGPDGGSLTGTSIFKDSGSTFVRLNQNVAVVQNTTYTFSAYVRAPSGGNPYIRLAAFNGGTWLNTTGGCTLSSVTITNTVGGGSVFNGVPSGSWVRVWVTFTTQAAQTTATIAFYPDADTSNAATMYCWGSQVETGSGPSSVIPTGASQGSRAADVCYMANADYGFSTSGGTYLAEWHRGSIITTGSTGNNAFATDYASGRWLGIYTSGASSTGTAGSWSGYLSSSGAVSGINKMAVSYSSWVASASGNTSLNGGAIVSGTLTLGTTPTYLFVGAASGTAPYSGGGYRDPLNNCVRRIKYWPSVLPNAQLQSLTT